MNYTICFNAIMENIKWKSRQEYQRIVRHTLMKIPTSNQISGINTMKEEIKDIDRELVLTGLSGEESFCHSWSYSNPGLIQSFLKKKGN